MHPARVELQVNVNKTGTRTGQRWDWQHKRTYVARAAAGGQSAAPGCRQCSSCKWPNARIAVGARSPASRNVCGLEPRLG
jgi:hypothetical protein